jgi:hypothetical protein
MNRRYSRILMLIATVAAVAFIYTARFELLSALSSVSFGFLGLTYLATLALNLTLWVVFHKTVGAGSDYLLTSKMFFGAQVAKYVPGKVWGIVYQAALKSDAVPVGNIVQGNIVIYALSVLSTIFACLALIIYPTLPWLAVAVLIVGAALSAYFASSDHLYMLLQRVSRLSKKIELTSEVPATNFSLSSRLVIYILLTSLYVVSNVFLLYVFYDFPLSEALKLTAYLGIAWVAGLVVAITPSGLGVREAVFVAIGTLSDPGSYQLYASIAIVARVVQVGQDLVSAFLVPFVVGLVGRRAV